jgi:uncharacterized protein YbjQ (UPF0145 family)
VTGPTGPDWTPEQVAQGSAAEIAAGRLPLRAQWRIAEQRARRDRGEPGSFTSNLSIEEFAAIRSVGFAPVGQVMGSAVYQIGWSYGGCGYGFGGFGGGLGRGFGGGFARGGFAGGGFPGGGIAGGTSGGGWTPAPVVPVEATRQLLEQARHRAVDRMRAECVGLGGDGVVGVRLTIAPFYDNGLEFMAVGTAVRAAGDRHPARPFTSDLSGQDFAKLIRSGWVPVALVQGVGAVIRHDDWATQTQQRSWTNQEIAGTTQLVHLSRDAARSSLGADARRQGGHTVLLQDLELRVHRQSCPNTREGHDHVATAYLWGTAVVPFRTDASLETPPLTIMRL